ncbi:MAG: hypothetical protein IJ567_11690 [Lachnospiraceae bacterium]|nr:hypothetical protein [Lachnospiraceae bacterium]
MKIFRVTILGLMVFMLSGCSDTAYSTDHIEDYDKEYVVENYHSDLDSNLSVFPDELSTVNEVASFHASLSTNLFDTDGEIILDCVYENDQFHDEIERLANLSMTIKNRDEQYTNSVLYDTEGYHYPAYITIDGFGNTYEYALIDQDNHEIIYIYLAYPNVRDFPYRDYLKKDLSLYEEENTLDAYSMYNHSFDDGESWTEFDDGVVIAL